MQRRTTNNISIGVKIVVTFLLAILLLGLVWVILLVTSTESLTAEVSQQRIVQEVNVIESNLVEAQRELEAASFQLVNSGGLVDTLSAQEVDVVQLQSQVIVQLTDIPYTDLKIIDASGEVIFQSPRSRQGIDLDALDRLLALSLFGLENTSTAIITVDGSPTLNLAIVSTIYDENGNALGGMLLSRVIDETFLSNLKLDNEDVNVYLVLSNSDGVAARTVSEKHTVNFGDDHASNLDFAAINADDRLETTINTALLQTASGIPYSEAFIPVQVTGDAVPSATLVVHVSQDALDTFQTTNLQRSLLVLLLSALVASGVTILILRTTVINPLQSLRQMAEALSRGQYDVRSEVKSGDEFGVITTTFNQMAVAVQAREQELVNINATLEMRVEERTQQLKVARDEAIAAKRIADENSRLKSEFLSMMSHELRTPMNAIEGFTSLMLTRLGGVEFNEKAERYLRKIESNSQRLLGLINDFLDLSRIESGRLELSSLPVSLQSLSNKWGENLSVLAEEKGLKFSFRYDPSLPATVYGDEEALSKVAINLISNAIKFTDEGFVTVELKRNDNMMVLVVADSGIGIPPHAQEFIFEEFRQVDQSTRRKHGGTGLGLAIVQKLTRAMGGTVTLDSTVGQGSTFTVQIPLRAEMETA
jgi:signal transduction histidine kinase